MKNTEQVIPEIPSDCKPLVFTDMDGTLLDHHNYSYEPAEALLFKLEEAGIPVILSSSKTKAEILPWRKTLKNRHPFVTENGAAVYLPSGYFSETTSLSGGKQAPDLSKTDDGFICASFSRPRKYWQELLNDVETAYSGLFCSFSGMGTEGIMASTGLDREQAEQANRRQFSEPVLWLGEHTEKAHFIKTLLQKGANVLEGGRFMHIGGAHNKGLALEWLASAYQKEKQEAVFTIALGDGKNDIAMLESADIAVVIRSPVNPRPVPQKKAVIFTEQYGPQAWKETVSALLSSRLAGKAENLQPTGNFINTKRPNHGNNHG
ncbi:MAG: HAD-IIB family hydrolase [Pseudomonadales bacterium]|nr:HAD-IIB family hydrolase [Pseudomonadales bacterium]